MTTWQLIASTWEWEPSVVIGCLGLAVGYLWLRRFRVDRRTWLSLLGDLTILFALVSSLDGLGDGYLFSAHMLQHLLLLLLAPPLLILGMPEDLLEKLLNWRPAAHLEKVLARPLVAWVLAVGNLWLWHIPALYNQTLVSEQIHTLEHLSFLVTWTIYWWPVWTPLKDHRLPPSSALVYLFTGGFANTLLGILLTFAPGVLYTGYLHPEGSPAGLHLIRDVWQIGVLDDQQLGGLFMWVAGMLGFIWPILAEVGRFYRKTDHADAAPHNPAVSNG